MTAQGYILFPGTVEWRIGVGGGGGRAGGSIDVPISPGADAVAIAGAVAAALRGGGYRGQGVVLAPSSETCLCASVKTAGLPPKNRRRAMAYRLEEKLPIAVEDVVADFVPQDVADDDVTLGVCAQKRPLAEIVDALEAAGVAVAAICPAALLSLQAVLDEGTKERLDAVVWPNDRGGGLELFTLRNGRPGSWSIVDGGIAGLMRELRLELGADAGGNGPRVIGACGIAPEVLKSVTGQSDLRWSVLSIDPRAGATSLAGSVLAGTTAPWIDLRRDELAVGDGLRRVRTPLTAAGIALVCLLVALCGAMLWRSGRYDAAAAGYAEEQRAEFRRAFPGTPVPADVRSRLEAEERNVRGLSGGDTAAPADRRSALVTLRELVTHLPEEEAVRYRILELRLDGGDRFTLEGQATAHGDADAIAASLKRGNAFTVEPPRTEALTGATGDAAARGVAFTLSGRAGK